MSHPSVDLAASHQPGLAGVVAGNATAVLAAAVDVAQTHVWFSPATTIAALGLALTAFTSIPRIFDTVEFLRAGCRRRAPK